MADKVLGVVGAGVMGRAIAQVAAQSGYQVTLMDTNPAQLESIIPSLESVLADRVRRGRMTDEEKSSTLAMMKERVQFRTSLQDVAKCPIIVESVYEDISVKGEVFSTLDSLCSPNTLLASNTSTFPITTIASYTKHPDRVIGMHFFNPVQAMRLVEIIQGHLTSEATVAAARELAESMGKSSVVVKDGAGFVVNRLLAPMINEAVFILMEGLATKEDIDTAMKMGCNHPMGPLELADLIGLDICLHEIETLHEYLGDSKYRPCPLMRQMVAAGLLGRKTGRGFYEYS